MPMAAGLGGGVGSPGTAALVRLRPQRRRRPHRGLSDLVCHSGTFVIETVYRREIGPALGTATPAYLLTECGTLGRATVLRPVQAHVQAGGGARLAGSGLDKVTDLVDQPQAVTA
jgi:hypothetical protein